MSENEKLLQVGRLAEEYSKLKGELNHVEQKALEAQRAYQAAGNNFQHLTVSGDRVIIPPQYLRNLNPQPNLDALLSAHELKELFLARERLRAELKESGDRLTELAPHLVRA